MALSWRNSGLKSNTSTSRFVNTFFNTNNVDNEKRRNVKTVAEYGLLLKKKEEYKTNKQAELQKA